MVPRFQNRSEPKPVSVLSPIGENHTQNHTGARWLVRWQQLRAERDDLPLDYMSISEANQ